MNGPLMIVEQFIFWKLLLVVRHQPEIHAKIQSSASKPSLHSGYRQIIMRQKLGIKTLLKSNQSVKDRKRQKKFLGVPVGVFRICLINSTANLAKSRCKLAVLFTRQILSKRPPGFFLYLSYCTTSMLKKCLEIMKPTCWISSCFA